jgi:hypothetical protein
MTTMNQAKSEALDAKNIGMVRILKSRGFSIEFSVNNRRNLFQVGAIASSRQDMQAMYFASFATRSDAQAYANMLRGV